MVAFVRDGPGHASVSSRRRVARSPRASPASALLTSAERRVPWGFAMEAATPLRQPRVHVLMGRVIVENVVVDDPATASFLDRRIDAGEDATSVVIDAIEIGARVLEREQARSTRSSCATSSRRSRARWRPRSPTRRASWPSSSAAKVDEVFGAENGHLAKELPRLFGDGSSAAVQHQLRQMMLEQSARMREDLLRQFSSADGSNPLADFKAAHLRAARDAATRQEAQLEAMREQMVALKLELQRLQVGAREGARRSPPRWRARRPRAARTRRRWPRPSTRSRAARATTARRSATSRGAGGRKGDVVVDIDGCAGAAARAGSSSRPRTRASRARRRWPSSRRRWRSASADYGVWVVPSEDRLPARAHGAARGRRGQALRRLSTPRRVAAGAWRSPTRWPARGC